MLGGVFFEEMTPDEGLGLQKSYIVKAMKCISTIFYVRLI